VHRPRGRGVAHGLILPVASRTPLVQRLFASALAAAFARGVAASRSNLGTAGRREQDSGNTRREER
jgi:hypothetical protein